MICFPRLSCFGPAECQGARNVRARRGRMPVHFCLRASTRLSRRLRMLLSACRAKCCAKTSALMVQAGCHPRKPAIWTSKWQTSPSACKAFRRRCRDTWDEGSMGGSCLSRAAACFWHSVSFPCGRELQPRRRSLCRCGLSTTSAKGMPQVRLCNLAFPSMARMSARSWEASNCARRLHRKCGRKWCDVGLHSKCPYTRISNTQSLFFLETKKCKYQPDIKKLNPDSELKSINSIPSTCGILGTDCRPSL